MIGDWIVESQQKKILLIVPAYNEVDNIERVLETLINKFPQYDYVVINDGSTDGTGRLCIERGYQVINLPINLGIGGAVQTGYMYALKNGYEYAVQLDGDGQHDAAYVETLIKPLMEGSADVVVGSRFLEKEGFQSSRSRRIGINILSRLIWICTGKHILDVTSGFRAVNQRFIAIYAEDYPSDYPEPEAIITAVMHKGRVAEVPVVMKEREGGISSINFRKSIYYMIKVTLAILIKRLSYGVRR